MKGKTKRFFRRMVVSAIRARRMQAATYVAYHLVHTNKDFRDTSPYELAQKIAKGHTTEEILKAI